MTTSHFTAHDIFHYNDYLHRHPQTGVIKQMDSSKIKYKICGYNFFHEANGNGEVIVNYVWSLENPLTNIKAAFTDMKQFHGNFFLTFYRVREANFFLRVSW